MTALELGAKYSCFEDFQAALAKYSRDTNSIYTIFNSKSIEAENRGRTPDKQYPVSLKYRFIKYTCKHYGNVRTKGRGLRPNQSSFKIGCPAFIYVSVQKNELVVEKMETKHSHVCDPDVINFYPERRSLLERTKHLNINLSGEDESDLIKSVREDVLDLLQLHVDRRRIRNYVRLRTNRVLVSADLSNLAKQMQGNERQISEPRSRQLLNMLSDLESKENEPTRIVEDIVKREKYKALKRKIIPSIKVEGQTPGGGESFNESVQEHGYSNQTPDTPQKWWSESKENDSPGPSPSKRKMTLRSQGLEWDSLEEMVKTLNPEEGPVLVHMNNFDGVMVVEIPNGQGGVTQLEGTVVEVEEDMPGDDSRLLSESALGEPPELPNEEPLMNQTPPKKPPEESGKIKKIIQFRKREPKAESAEIVPRNSEPQNLINLAMKSVECHSKVEDLESDHGDDMDNRSEANSDIVPLYVDCANEEEFHDVDQRMISPILSHPNRARLEAETEMLRVKTNKLKLQVKYLRNELVKQDLEQEKLRLEIVLLKARIGINEVP